MKNSKVIHVSSLGLATISPIFILTLPFLSLFVGKQVGIFGRDPLVKRVTGISFAAKYLNNKLTYSYPRDADLL